MSDSEDETEEKQLKVVFVGESNVGKTAIIKRYCYDEFSRQYVSTSGVDFFLKRIPLPGSNYVTIKIFDVGGDALAVIEKYTENVRFCIICNYLGKIIPALQSRCTRFRFGPLNNDQIIPRLNHVIEQEKLTVTDDGKQALLTLANGDMRKVLNILQSTWLAYKYVNEENVYICVGHPMKNDIENIVKWLLTEDIDVTYKNIKTLKVSKGLALMDILSEVHLYIQRIEFPSEVFVYLLIKLSDIEMRLATGTNEDIQLSALISAFQIGRDLVEPQS